VTVNLDFEKFFFLKTLKKIKLGLRVFLVFFL